VSNPADDRSGNGSHEAFEALLVHLRENEELRSSNDELHRIDGTVDEAQHRGRPAQHVPRVHRRLRTVA